MYPNPYGNQYPNGAPPFGSGYPQQQPPFGSGYPPQQPPFGSGYPPQQPQAPFGSGYPPQQPSFGSEYPPQQPQAPFGGSGYPPQQPAYPTSMPMPVQQQQLPPQGMVPPPQQAFNYQSPPMPMQQNQPVNQSVSYPNLEQIPPQQNSYQNYGSAPPPTHQQQQYQPNHVNQGRPTVHPAPNFDASNDCAILRRAMKGFGTDEDAIISVLCRRPSSQRMEIVRAYKTSYGKCLLDDIRSETSGNFQQLLLSLLVPTHEFLATEIHKAVSGAGTDETALLEVMCMLTNYEIKSIGYAYYQKYHQTLEQVLRGDTSGHFKRLMTSLSVGGRDESMQTNISSAQNDASELKRAGVDKWGTDESTYQRIFCTRNYEQLKLVAQEYEKLTGRSMEKDIKSEFSGDIEDGLLTILRTAINRPESFAIRLHKSMAGLGTNDNSLIRLVVTRSEIDMEDIKDAFLRKYGKTLKSFIKGDTSGHYKHALYALIGENRS